MYLECYSKEGEKVVSTLVKDIGDDFQAEGWVSYSHFDPRVTENFFKWILCDGNGTRCVWEYRKDKDDIPNITQRSSRFTGNWEKGPNEIEI